MGAASGIDATSARSGLDSSKQSVPTNSISCGKMGATSGTDGTDATSARSGLDSRRRSLEDHWARQLPALIRSHPRVLEHELVIVPIKFFWSRNSHSTGRRSKSCARTAPSKSCTRYEILALVQLKRCTVGYLECVLPLQRYYRKHCTRLTAAGPSIYYSDPL